MEKQSANLGKEIKIKEEKNNPNKNQKTGNQTQPDDGGGKKSSWWKWLLGCCGGALILTIIISLVSYFTFGKKVIDQAKELSENEPDITYEEFQDEFFKGVEVEPSQEDENGIKQKDSKVSNDPNQVVENYLNSVLGTLPDSDLDDSKAKSYLSEELQRQYDDSEFIQQTLCIQDGPSKIEIGNKDAYGEEAYVTVKANYDGKYLDIWDFALRMENDEWTIYAIYCLTN